MSVVIPVYNVENLLRRCVDSLLRQSVSPLEIILVDDGSPDNSGMICDEYAASYDCIKVIHKNNGGLSSARKAGWEIARGELICFIDSDDYVSETYIEKLSQAFCDTGVDLCMCAWSNDRNGYISSVQLPYAETIIENCDIPERYILPVIGPLSAIDAVNIPGFVCLRMYRTSMLQKTDFVSEREYFTEDIILNILYASRIEGNIAIINESLYYYCINPGSLTLRYRENAFDKLLACNRLCRQITNDIPVDQTCRIERLDANMVSAITYGIYNIGKIRDYRRFRVELNQILTTSEVRQVFERKHWPTRATWHRIILFAYRFKAYFILYELLKFRKTL